ncbi:MAG: hypothetical protein Q7S75_01485 [bacterium]|nr:hypothetical protein [bacterium]
MNNKAFRIIAVVAILIVSAYVVLVSQKDTGKTSATPAQQKQVSYTNTIAQTCSQSKNTMDENKNLSPGLVYIYFKSGYPISNIRDFLTRNSYQIQGEIYSELQGKHSVYLFVPVGEELCWARELGKETGVESVRLLSTLKPD